MSKGPATPEKSGDNSVENSMLTTSSCNVESSNANVMRNEHEPSPASTYGLSVVGDSAPVTPCEIRDPAILARSLRSSGGILNDSIAHGNALGPSSISPVKTGAITKYATSRSTSVSVVSSPRANRTRDIQGAVSWRADSQVFDISDNDTSDVFVVPAGANTELGPSQSARGPSPTMINGVPVTNDNAQALLPPTACVFVANLASTRTDEQLEESVTRIFEQFGRVYVKIRRDARGMPYAFCQYENISDSESAIELGRGVVIDGRHCRTERAKAHRSLYLSRITGGPISEDEAHSVLDQFGPLEKLWIASPTDREMFRLPDGIWVMWSYFQGARDAQNAFKEHPRYRLEEPNLPMDVRTRERSRPSSATRVNHGQFIESPQQRIAKAPDRTSLYIGGLPDNVTQSQLCALFHTYGTVRGVEIISKMMSTGGICVFAFVEMASEEEVKRAVGKEFTLEGTRLRVEVKHSPAHTAHRSYHVVSTGSPRRRNERASSESVGGMVNPALAMSRALAAGIHPAVISYILGNSNTLPFIPPANTANHSALPMHQMAPIYSQVTYDTTYHTNHLGQFGSPNTNSEDGASSGHFQYPPGNYQAYSVPGPIMYPPPTDESTISVATVRANLLWEP